MVMRAPQERKRQILTIMAQYIDPDERLKRLEAELRYCISTIDEAIASSKGLKASAAAQMRQLTVKRKGIYILRLCLSVLLGAAALLVSVTGISDFRFLAPVSILAFSVLAVSLHAKNVQPEEQAIVRWGRDHFGRLDDEYRLLVRRKAEIESNIAKHQR